MKGLLPLFGVEHIYCMNFIFSYIYLLMACYKSRNNIMNCIGINIIENTIETCHDSILENLISTSSKHSKDRIEKYIVWSHEGAPP